MQKQIIIILSIFSIGMASRSFSQSGPNPVLVADSLATGNYKDVLNSFFQLTLDRLTGPNKEIKFTSSPFAVMARMDTSLLIDTSYLKYRTLRNINFSFSGKLDDSYKFNGFTSGVKYAIINKRDETVSRTFLKLVTNNDNVKALFALNDSMIAYVTKLPPAQQPTTILQIRAFTNGTKNFNDLDASLQQEILRVASLSPATQVLAATLQANNQYNMRASADSIYANMKNLFNNNLLWTIGVSDTTYNNEFAFSNIVVSSELLKGISSNNSKNDLELNLKANFQMVDDALIDGNDLKRSVLSFEPGINFVFKTKDRKKSFFEFKLSGSYNHIFTSLYPDEKRDELIVNSTVRVRIFKDIWIPLEIKYDPKNGNFLGLLNIRANFTSLGNIAKSINLN